MTAIVFDLGKVLLNFDYSIAARRIAALCRRPVDPQTFFAAHSSLLLRYELGRLTTPEFCQEIRRACEFAGTDREFEEPFADIFTAVPEMLELHASLRRAGYPTYVFSNTNDLAVVHIRRHFPFFANFDGYIFSYEHNAMKPDPKLYEIVERQAGRLGGDILYVDDRPENVAAGLARGWRAILHQSPERTRAAFDPFLPRDSHAA